LWSFIALDPHVENGGGLGRKRSIRRRISANWERGTANDRAHRGVAGEPLGVIDILVAGEPIEHPLAEVPAQLVARVLATAAVEELRDRRAGAPEGVIQLAVSEQTASAPGMTAQDISIQKRIGIPKRIWTFMVTSPGKLTLSARGTCARSDA
jgi:hypothetical protein